MILHLFTQDRLIGRARVWFRGNYGSSTLIAIPRLSLEPGPTIEIAEGETLLGLFKGSLCNLDGQSHPITIYSGYPELFTRSTPTLKAVIGLVRVKDNLGLADIIRHGVDLLRAYPID